MEVNITRVFIFINAVVIVTQGFLVLAEHLVALACIHVILGQIAVGALSRWFLILGPDRCTEVVECALELLKVHIAAASITKSLRVVYTK